MSTGYNRYIIDFLQWLHDLLVFRKEKNTAYKPVEKLGKAIRGRYGTIQEIRRNFPPSIPNRDVAAWVFCPYPMGESKRSQNDIYVICLTLSPVENLKPKTKSAALKKGTRRRRNDPTHRVLIVKTNHFLPRAFDFEAEALYSEEWDFQGNDPYPGDRYAVKITGDLAKDLQHHPMHRMDWQVEIYLLRRIVMGSDYTSPPAALKNAIEAKIGSSQSNPTHGEQNG